MVAYSFRERFIRPIKLGLEHDPGSVVDSEIVGIFPKRQTIREVGKRRHGRAGDTLQLYTGMRTRNCYLIGLARCTRAREISLSLSLGMQASVSIIGETDDENAYYGCSEACDKFARCDGFQDWSDMVAFWRETHGGWSSFVGVLIEWEPIK